MMAAPETEAETTTNDQVEAVVKCYCCGLTEECTQVYIDDVRERYQGRWICGLCAEAVKEELLALELEESSETNSSSATTTTTDEALKRHMDFRSSTSSPPNKPTLDLIIAVKQLLFRSLDSPRKQKQQHPLTTTTTTTLNPPLARSRSCFSTVTAMTSSTTQPAEPQPHAN